MLRSQHASSRRGISLVEIMFAIGVAFTGLLGVAVLVPVAAQRMGQGVTADEAGAFGRSILADYEARGMARTDAYAVWDGSNFVAYQQFQPHAPNTAFCVDPYMLITDATQNLFPVQNPNVAPADLYTIPRVTFRPIAAAPSPINQALADELLRFSDDLVFDRPKDRTLPPIQRFTADDSVTPAPTEKRQYEGGLTWLATLSPDGSNSRQYTLSIVVFKGRTVDPTDLKVENVAQVAFLGSGQGGGDIMLMPISGSGLTASDIDIRPGNWLMLASETAGPRFVRWYRVTSADKPTTTLQSGPFAGNDVKFASIAGADWPSGEPTQATIMKDVAAVFERTIQLETSSLWKLP